MYATAASTQCGQPRSRGGEARHNVEAVVGTVGASHVAEELARLGSDSRRFVNGGRDVVEIGDQILRQSGEVAHTLWTHPDRRCQGREGGGAEGAAGSAATVRGTPARKKARLTRRRCCRGCYRGCCGGDFGSGFNFSYGCRCGINRWQ